MHDFGNFCYLDMHKTGSTFVSRFLRHAAVSDEVLFLKHAPVSVWCPSVFYFVTIREPQGWYGSLYRYGLDRRGAIFERLRAAQKLAEYASFDRFVRFMHDPVNARLLGEGYNEEIASSMGFMTFRYCKLTILNFYNTYADQNASSGFDGLNSRSIINLELKMEDLRSGLYELMEGPLCGLIDVKRAHEFLTLAPALNQSQNWQSTQQCRLSRVAYELLINKERLMFSKYERGNNG